MKVKMEAYLHVPQKKRVTFAQRAVQERESPRAREARALRLQRMEEEVANAIARQRLIDDAMAAAQKEFESSAK